MKFSKLTSIVAISVALTGLSACNSMMGSNADTSTTKTATHHSAKTMAKMNAAQLAASNPDLSILVEAVQAAGLGGALSNPNANYTIFAPTNDAFAALLTETGLTKDQLMANKPLLRKVLAYHVVNAKAPIYAKDVAAGQVPTLGGETFEVTPQTTIKDGKGRTANIIKTDLAATNGVVHVIDTVLLPAK